MTSSGPQFERFRKVPDPQDMADWKSFQGPANWFTLRYPAHCTVHRKDTFIEIRPQASGGAPVLGSRSDGDLDARASAAPAMTAESNTIQNTDPGRGPTLILGAQWVEEDRTSQRPAFADVMACFPDVVASRPERGLTLDSPSQCWSGMSRRPARGSWWQRFWNRRPAFQWWFWKIRHGNIQIVALIQSEAGAVLSDDDVDICENILNSLRLAPEPAFPPEVFRRAVVTLASKRFPLLTIRPSGPFELRIEDSEISLSNFYRCYLQQPHRLEQIVLPGIAAVVRMRELSPEQLIPPLPEARHRILPMLTSEAPSRDDAIPSIPWVAGLSLRFVLDDDDSYRFVNRAFMAAWKLSLEQLRQIAMLNLKRVLREHSPIELVASEANGRTTMLAPARPDAYNCTRLLDEGFQASLREQLGPEVVVGAPNRDFFVAVSAADLALLLQIRRRVEQDFQTMHHPLSQRLLVISADGVSEYCPD